MNALFEKREEAARAAAQAVALTLRNLIAQQGRAVILVDCASRPLEFLECLIAEAGIDWTQVIVFQACEFIGEGPDSLTSCQHFLTKHFISRVPVVTFHPMRADAPNPRAAISNLSERLARMPADIAFLSGELFAALTALDDSAGKIAGLRLGDRVTIAFTLDALEKCRVFILGESSGFANRKTTELNEKTFLFTNS